VNDVNNNQILDAGDAFTIVALNCAYSGASLNGTMGFVLNSYSGDIVNSDVYSLNMAMTLTNLAATDATGTVTANASMNAILVSTGFNNSVFTINTSNYAMTSVRAGVTYNRTLTGFTSTLTTTPTAPVPPGGFSESLTANGTISSSGLDNHSVVFATVTPFVQYRVNDPNNPDAGMFSQYPISGSATITGASGSRIALTVQDNNLAQPASVDKEVLVELDADGNNTPETSKRMLWTDLL
jgi:hypothetical protein